MTQTPLEALPPLEALEKLRTAYVVGNWSPDPKPLFDTIRQALTGAGEPVGYLNVIKKDGGVSSLTFNRADEAPDSIVKSYPVFTSPQTPTPDPVECPAEYRGEDDRFYVYDFAPQRIHFRTKAGDMTALQVRGWGHLTGHGGGLGMSEKDAAKAQDQFGRWVAETLTKAIASPQTPTPDPDTVPVRRELIEEAISGLKAFGGELTGDTQERLSQALQVKP